MKKLEMEYESFIFICTIIFYPILCIRFSKELLMLSLRSELVTFAYDFLSYRSYNYDLN